MLAICVVRFSLLKISSFFKGNTALVDEFSTWNAESKILTLWLFFVVYGLIGLIFFGLKHFLLFDLEKLFVTLTFKFTLTEML